MANEIDWNKITQLLHATLSTRRIGPRKEMTKQNQKRKPSDLSDAEKRNAERRKTQKRPRISSLLNRTNQPDLLPRWGLSLRFKRYPMLQLPNVPSISETCRPLSDRLSRKPFRPTSFLNNRLQGSCFRYSGQDLCLDASTQGQSVVRLPCQKCCMGRLRQSGQHPRPSHPHFRPNLCHT